MNDSKNIRLRVSRVIAAKRQKVFRAWTDPVLMQQWLCPVGMSLVLAEAEPVAGGRYKLLMKNSDGEIFDKTGVYEEIIPDAKLVFTWNWEGSDWPETRVTVELHDKGDGTEVVITHDRFPDQGLADRHDSGWRSCLENLAARIDGFA